MFDSTWVAVAIVVLVLYYQLIDFMFGRHGIKYFRPIPLLGNMARVVLHMENIADNLLRQYFSFQDERFVGRYEFTQKVIFIRDIELAKKITVKDFDCFENHRNVFGTSDSYFGKSLIALKGQQWKDMRSTLSPAFTSSKIRQMLPFITEVGDQMIRSLRKRIEESETGHIEVDCNDLTTRYANDVIASCAFGLKVDSYNDAENEFYAMGKASTTFTYRHMMLSFLIQTFPKLAKVFKLDFLTKAAQTFFRELVMGTMDERETKEIIRPDMIHLLMLAKKGELNYNDVRFNKPDVGFAAVKESIVGQNKHNRVWSDDDLVAQAVLFFLAGFGTASSGMAFLLYELAVNPDIQDRLAQEIRETAAMSGGKFDLDSIQDMPYMDMVISELLRKWPPGPVLDRVCNKDYNLGKPNDKTDKDFIVCKGTGIAIPVFAFHRDPQYFPDPEKFDPERFSEENKHKIQPYTYMPFGAGPRNCIASRFALCELKALTYHILQHLMISPSEKTCIPARLDKAAVNMKLAGGDWFIFSERK